MQFGRVSWSKNGEDTVRVITNPELTAELSPRTGVTDLPDLDAAKLNALYSCNNGKSIIILYP